MKLSLCAGLTALGLVAFAAEAHDFRKNGLVIDHPMAFETAPGALAAAGYLTITNTGDRADRLLSVSANFPKVMLHGTEETDGVARMFHVDHIDIPAGETVALTPGGLHVMFMGLDGDPFDAGEHIPATLIFAEAGEVEIVFHVEARSDDDAPAHDHSGHGAAHAH